jgi:P-type Ca2+ transporter type 2C
MWYLSEVLLNEVTGNKFIWLALVICTVAVIAVFSVPQARLVLGLSILPAKLWVIAIIASLFPICVVQAYKLLKRIAVINA